MSEQPATRTFHLGDILSITTSILVSPRYMDGVYDLITYLTYQEPDLSRLSEVMVPCRDYLLQIHPDLEDLDTTDLKFENWRGWLQTQQRTSGEWIEVRRPEPGQIAC